MEPEGAPKPRDLAMSEQMLAGASNHHDVQVLSILNAWRLCA